MTDKLRIAALQMITRIAGQIETSQDTLDHNFATAARLVAAAAAQGCKLAALPENLLTFGTRAHFSRDQQQAWLVAFSDLARRNALWLVAGSLPLEHFASQEDVSMPLRWLDDEHKPFATSVVFGSDGVLRAVYRKMHLFDARVDDGTGVYRESEHFRAGSAPCVVDTPWGVMGLGICYDLRFPEYFRALRELGAHFVVLPSAFTWATGEAHWELLLRARAVENQLFVIGVNQGGGHSATRKTWGDSMIIDTWGQVLVRVGNMSPSNDSQLGEALLIADLDFEQLRNIRVKMPVWEHRKCTVTTLTSEL